MNERAKIMLENYDATIYETIESDVSHTPVFQDLKNDEKFEKIFKVEKN